MKGWKMSAFAAFMAMAALLVSPAVMAADAPKTGDKAMMGEKGMMDEKAMMELYMKAATPGPEHQALAKMAGSWSLEVTSYMAPGAPPEKSTATAEFAMILGGRVMTQKVRGEMMGQPYEGLGLEGFDNTTKENWGIWMDNWGTGILQSTGKCAVGAKTCTMSGSMVDPATGKPSKVREVLTHTSDTSMTFDMYGPDPNGKEFHMMQIVYTKK
jgi:hypothetical protein